MSSRAKGLWWKEWRQLRLLRIVGAALILVAPVMLLSAAEAAKRGWVPLNAMQNYSAATVMQDALPMFLGFLIWPLLAMMCVAQSYCGDIATGTEWFWMERPVRPRRIWATRLLASMLSLLGIVVVHWVVWRLLVFLWGDPGAFDAVGAALWAGLGITVAAFLSALAASAFARTPMQALPLGLMLAVLPLGLGQLLEAIFPYGRVAYSSINLAGLVPLLLFVAYVGVSYRSACKGEPAGRGKLKRALSALAVSVVAVIALGVPTGIWATHRAELTGLIDSTVVASRTGDRFFIFNNRQHSGWLFDVKTGDELLHLSPYVIGAAWHADGDRLAVVRMAGMGNTVAEIYDRDGTRLVENLDCEGCYNSIAWAGERLMVSTRRNRAWGLDWIDPATGERGPAEVDSAEIAFALIGPTIDGTTYVARQILVTGGPGTDATEPSEERRRLLLYAVGLDANLINEPVTIDGIDRFRRFGAVAPDGSAVLTEDVSGGIVIDLAGKFATEIGYQPAWLHPNRPVWTARHGEDLAILIEEEGEVRALRHFEGHGWAYLSSSPDGRRLLLVRRPSVDRPDGDEPQHWLYDDETQSWTELEQTKLTDRYDWPAEPRWINNDTVVLAGVGMLALCEPGVPGSLRVLK